MGNSLYNSMAQSQVTVSDVFNQTYREDRDQNLKVASIIRNDPNYTRKPDYYINIFNVAPVEFVRHRPVDFPRIVIKACPEGEPWVLAVKVPNIIVYKQIMAETGQPSFSSLRGERWATDLLNPANLGEDIWAEVGAGDLDLMHGSSDDLTRRGCFWSLNEVPNPDELRKCRAKLEKHYRQCIQDAEKLARENKMNEIGAEPHLAANYLRVSTAWHVMTAVPVPCPNCGEPINPGVAFHASSVGGVCVIDWERSVKAGVKKREDVPVEARWWTPEPERPHKNA